MRKLFQLGVPLAVLSLGVMFSTASFGKPEYTKKEKKACIYCHVAANSKDLNDVGKCYAKSHSLDGCTK